MEKYLKEQYDIFEDKKYLTKEEDLERYFLDNGPEYFDCGQGFYQNEAILLVKVGDKFYDVTIEAEIASAKQDSGDRLYWVDNITNVSYEERDKPLPKELEDIQYNLSLTESQKTRLESFMKENFIEIK